MTMLRRPLTQLELCDDDIQWLSEQLSQKEEAVTAKEAAEPMDQSEPPRGITRKNLRSADKKNKAAPGTSSGGAQCSRVSTYDANIERMSFTEVQTMTSAQTPVAGSSLSLSTPVMNAASSSSDTNVGRAPQPRPGRRPRGSRGIGDIAPPLLFSAYDTPQQPSGNNSSPTPSDSPESPNAHLYATPSNPANSGGPSSNTRSHRH